MIVLAVRAKKIPKARGCRWYIELTKWTKMEHMISVTKYDLLIVHYSLFVERIISGVKMSDQTIQVAS